MGALIGLGVGIGLLLIWSAFMLPRPARSAPRPEGRTAQLLARAGMHDVSVERVRAACALGAVWSPRS